MGGLYYKVSVPSNVGVCGYPTSDQHLVVDPK